MEFNKMAEDLELKSFIKDAGEKEGAMVMIFTTTKNPDGTYRIGHYRKTFGFPNNKDVLGSAVEKMAVDIALLCYRENLACVWPKIIWNDIPTSEMDQKIKEMKEEQELKEKGGPVDTKRNGSGLILPVAGIVTPDK